MPGPPPSWLVARRLFLAGVALVYGVAFGSLAVQVEGLFGSRGIQPVAELLAGARDRVAWWDAPSLLWLGAGDGLLVGLCWAGVLLALVALVGLVPRAAFAGLWVLYLSFASVGAPFLRFQWDALLLETGLLAVAWAPGGWRPLGRGERPPSRVVRWLVYALLFKLMLLSGVVKLTSGDHSWWDGTALDFHYWTQPLPHRLSWYAHWMPAWTHRAGAALMFAVELGVPVLLLLPWARRRLRQVAAAAVVLLMALIFATGNYGFFNLLTAVLCIPLLDDEAWTHLRRGPYVPPPPAPPAPWRGALAGGFAVLIALLSGERLARGLGLDAELPAPLETLCTRAAPFQSCNAYGLFRVMTRERPEIRIEGSADGAAWKAYDFRYGPLELERAPVFAGLHMPRLDWQLWFAALAARSGYREPWVPALLQRLLEGSPAVLRLFAENPFPDAPPRFVRASVAPYRFSSPEGRREGRWWERGEWEPFVPPRSLGSGR